MKEFWTARPGERFYFMFVQGIMALGTISGADTRPILFILLILAVLLLLAGAILAVVALRRQRKDVLHVTTLEPLEHETSETY
jgi:hypothetical protein